MERIIGTMDKSEWAKGTKSESQDWSVGWLDGWMGEKRERINENESEQGAVIVCPVYCTHTYILFTVCLVCICCHHDSLKTGNVKRSAWSYGDGGGRAPVETKTEKVV